MCEDAQHAGKRNGDARRTIPSRLLGDAVEHHFLTGAHFEAVAAVGGLDEEHIVARQPQDALHRRRYILVQAVWKLDDDYGATPRRSHQTPGDDATALTAKFP
jgi:hypothetical protein